MSITKQRRSAEAELVRPNEASLGEFLRDRWRIAGETMSAIRSTLASEHTKPKEGNSQKKTASSITGAVNADMDRRIESLLGKVTALPRTTTDFDAYCKELDAIVRDASRELNSYRYGKMNKYRHVLQRTLSEFRLAFGEWRRAAGVSRDDADARPAFAVEPGSDAPEIVHATVAVDFPGVDASNGNGESNGRSVNGGTEERADLSFLELLGQLGAETNESRVAFMGEKLCALASGAYWGYLVSLGDEPFALGTKVRKKQVDDLAARYARLKASLLAACTVEATASRQSFIDAVNAKLDELATEHEGNATIGKFTETALDHIRSFMTSQEDDELFFLSLLELKSADDFSTPKTVRELLMWQKLERGVEGFPPQQYERDFIVSRMPRGKLHKMRAFMKSNGDMQKISVELNNSFHGGHPFRDGGFVRSVIANEIDTEARPPAMQPDAVALSGASVAESSHEEIVVAGADPAGPTEDEVRAAVILLRQRRVDRTVLDRGKHVKELWQEVSARVHKGAKHANAEYRRRVLAAAFDHMDAEVAPARAGDLVPTADKRTKMEEAEQHTVALMVQTHRKGGGVIDRLFIERLARSLNIKRARLSMHSLTVDEVERLLPANGKAQSHSMQECHPPVHKKKVVHSFGDIGALFRNSDQTAPAHDADIAAESTAKPVPEPVSGDTKDIDPLAIPDVAASETDAADDPLPDVAGAPAPVAESAAADSGIDDTLVSPQPVEIVHHAVPATDLGFEPSTFHIPAEPALVEEPDIETLGDESPSAMDPVFVSPATPSSHPEAGDAVSSSVAAWMSGMIARINSHEQNIASAAQRLREIDSEIDLMFQGIDALVDQVDDMQVSARNAVSFCRNAILHLRIAESNSAARVAMGEVETLRLHLAKLAAFEALSATLRARIGEVSNRENEIRQRQRPVVDARAFMKLLQDPSIDFPSQLIGEALPAALTEADKRHRDLIRRLSSLKVELDDLWEAHVGVCHSDERSLGTVQDARDAAECVLAKLDRSKQVRSPAQSAAAEDRAPPSPVPSIVMTVGRSEHALSEIQVRCLQFLTAQTLDGKDVRHVSWGHTAAKLRSYWSRVVGEPVPTIDELVQALTDPSIVTDLRYQDTKVVTRAMRQSKTPLVLWKSGENEMFLPTHRAFDLMQEQRGQLAGGEFQAFKELKDAERAKRAEITKRISRKKKK